MFLIPGQMVHDRYRVIALLSKGGMGAVYEALDTTLGVRCALKEMVPYPGTSAAVLPQLREQFLQEARVLAELRHPNLPRVTDHFEEEDGVYLVMDYVCGKRLDEIIIEKKKLAEDEVLGWARQLMEALVHCHEHGVIHRDIKPQNVVITPLGWITLVDFGLAKLLDPNAPHTRTVVRGLGTPEYAPPEQYDAKKGSTDVRTDIYSLGATLYHALTGDPPPTVTERVVDPECLAPLSQHRDDVSKATERIIVKAMALRPSQRFQSVAEMHEALLGSPPSKVKIEDTAPLEDTIHLVTEPSSPTVLLPWIGAVDLRVDRRLWAALVVVGLVSLVTIISLMLSRINVGNVPTATATATLTASAIMTSTHTPTVTPYSTATPAPSPTWRPPRRQPTPEEFYLYGTPVTASPTSTQVYIPPSTHTPLPSPTHTPPLPPLPPARPKNTPTPLPTDTPPPTPTDTPTPLPTDTPLPSPLPTVRPTPTPGG
ncbi:MAG: serine/threonine-protein kinase [Chloroflexota bacterium]|nr:serine/threonine-protein kinase [Chloroflexota bacterium]